MSIFSIGNFLRDSAKLYLIDGNFIGIVGSCEASDLLKVTDFLAEGN